MSCFLRWPVTSGLSQPPRVASRLTSALREDQQFLCFIGGVGNVPLTSLHRVLSTKSADAIRELRQYGARTGRPAIAESRLSLLPDGRVAYSLKKTWRDGSTHVVMEPQVLI
ncbi:MAG: hypothetical protein ACJAQZ_004997, partial [Planctomycetota bacterium]